jgi:hypothetical protein
MVAAAKQAFSDCVGNVGYNSVGIGRPRGKRRQASPGQHARGLPSLTYQAAPAPARLPPIAAARRGQSQYGRH